MPKKSPTLFTTGFTQKSAREFFEQLRAAGVKRVLDVRLHNVSQLAGFTKRDDLQYFLREIVGVEYVHLPILAPSPELFEFYRRQGGAWETFEKRFLELMAERKIEKKLDPALISGGCLLCSEHKPHRCHRRLVAEYLQRHWGNLAIAHL